MQEELKQLGPLLFFLVILLAIKYSGFAMTKGKKMKQGFENIEYEHSRKLAYFSYHHHSSVS